MPRGEWRRSLQEKNIGNFHGKPKAYRYVLRQSRVAVPTQVIARRDSLSRSPPLAVLRRTRFSRADDSVMLAQNQTHFSKSAAATIHFHLT
jgi:hypothetical protein